MTFDSPELITKNPNILVMKTMYNKILLIDREWLLECPRLQDAYVFRELFRLNDNSPWGDYPMKQDSNGYLTLFKDLDIDTKYWLSLQTFLKTGFPSFWHDKSKRGYYLEHTNLVGNKLGGFPSFDTFYKKYHENIELGIDNNDLENYSPLKPENDYKDIYLWRIINPVDGSWQDNEYINSGWKITVLVEQNQISANKYFARKKKLLLQS
jgi:hypothetical protein